MFKNVEKDCLLKKKTEKVNVYSGLGLVPKVFTIFGNAPPSCSLPLSETE